MITNIDVILIDDSPFIRKAWRQVITVNGNYIRLTAEYAVSDVLKGALFGCTAHIVILQAETVKAAGSETLVLAIKQAIPLVKVVVTVSHGEEIQWARTLGADQAIKAPFEGYQLVNLIEGLIKDDRSVCEYYDGLLHKLTPGIKDWNKYEKLMGEIIHLLFSEHLVMQQPQSETHSKAERRDFVLFNVSNHTFWKLVRDRHQAHLVIIECKNTREAKTDHVIQLEDYLLPKAGSQFGVLAERVPPSQAVKMKIMRLCRNGIIVLAISDEEVHTMLAYKAAGIEPTDVLSERYYDLVSQTD